MKQELFVRICEQDGAWKDDGPVSRAEMINSAVMDLFGRVMASSAAFQSIWSAVTWEILDEDSNLIRFRAGQDELALLCHAAEQAHHEITGQQVIHVLDRSDMLILQNAASSLADAVDEQQDGAWRIYDPVRSSSKQEYVMSGRSAGFYADANGTYLKIEVTCVTDPESILELQREFGELPDPEQGEDDYIEACDI